MSKKIILMLTLLLVVTACEEKRKPRVIQNKELHAPLACLKLETIGVEKEFVPLLKKLHTFDEKCDYRLSVSSKKDIVCNSSYNAMSKNMGKFPKSFLKLEVHKGMKTLYSYYIDLYSNVDEEDVKEGFLRLQKDVLRKDVLRKDVL